jgi:hypothetical protein
MAEHKIMQLPELTKEAFYADPNSIYIRITYLPEQDGYRLTMFNELCIAEGEEDTDNKVRLFILARGLAEIALTNPEIALEAGYDAAPTDAIDLNDDLSDEEKELFKNTVGNA